MQMSWNCAIEKLLKVDSHENTMLNIVLMTRLADPTSVQFGIQTANNVNMVTKKEPNKKRRLTIHRMQMTSTRKFAAISLRTQLSNSVMRTCSMRNARTEAGLDSASATELLRKDLLTAIKYRIGTMVFQYKPIHFPAKP
jgi:hypothetical protein